MKLFNTLTCKTEIFQPINRNIIKMYVCGPTVYNFAHIGNARSVTVYDVLFRLLKHLYNDVLYVRNVTDVDDKIITSAIAEGLSASEISSKYYNEFISDTDYINCLRPTHEPKVTEHIEDIIHMISRIIENGSAYEVEGHVYYDVSSFPEYGKLSRKDLDTLIPGERVARDSRKLNEHDFVLWKPYSEDDIKADCYRDSPYGKGRPGWHIECSAISCRYLGADFDIHGGGADLKFPHHENEIAQSIAANPGTKFASYWVHNGFVTVEGEKMSKSLNNTITIRDLLKEGIEGSTIRYALLKTHYRKPLDWSRKDLQSAQNAVQGLKESLSDFALSDKNIEEGYVSKSFLDALSDDLNTPGAIAELHSLAKSVRTGSEAEKMSKAATLVLSADLLGLNLRQSKTNNALAESLIVEREEARKIKDYAKADKIREQLQSMGVKLKDKK